MGQAPWTEPVPFIREMENTMSGIFRVSRELFAWTGKRVNTVTLSVMFAVVALPLRADDGAPAQEAAGAPVNARSEKVTAGPASAQAVENGSQGLDLSQIDSPAWKSAIELMSKRPAVRAGNAQSSLLRVILKDVSAPEAPADARVRPQRVVNGVRLFVIGEPAMPNPRMIASASAQENLIHVSSTKLLSLDPEDGGGMLKELHSGDFVVVEHINSTRRKDGRDPVQVGSWTHRHADLWVPVPPRGDLGVLGDLVLERVPAEEMGRVIVELDTSAVPGGSFGSMHFGPIFTGGIFGRVYQATESGIAGSNRVSPGSYFLAMPGIKEKPGHWPVTVKPGETVYLRFRWNKERVLELVQTATLPPRAVDQVVRQHKPEESSE